MGERPPAASGVLLPRVRRWRRPDGYTWDHTDQWRRAAGYIDKILRGAYPGDLPVEGARKFDFMINLKTARALGLTIPRSILNKASLIQ